MSQLELRARHSSAVVMQQKEGPITRPQAGLMVEGRRGCREAARQATGAL